MDELFKDFYLLMPYGRGKNFEDKYINFASLVLGRHVHILYFEPQENGHVLVSISNVEKDDCILLFADFEENDEKTKAFFDSLREDYNHLEFMLR